MTPAEVTEAVDQLDQCWETVYAITTTYFEGTDGGPDVTAEQAERLLTEVGALAGACLELEHYLEDAVAMEVS